jgi:hypothetical protein
MYTPGYGLNFRTLKYYSLLPSQLKWCKYKHTSSERELFLSQILGLSQRDLSFEKRSLNYLRKYLECFPSLWTFCEANMNLNDYLQRFQEAEVCRMTFSVYCKLVKVIY